MRKQLKAVPRTTTIGKVKSLPSRGDLIVVYNYLSRGLSLDLSFFFILQALSGAFGTSPPLPRFFSYCPFRQLLQTPIRFDNE